CVQALEFPFTF
nr:immunoglobulin light chain junction region [Macaca mulatta]